MVVDPFISQSIVFVDTSVYGDSNPKQTGTFAPFSSEIQAGFGEASDAPEFVRLDSQD
jgi:hypothetical protein